MKKFTELHLVLIATVCLLLTLNGSAIASRECQTAAQREASVRKLSADVDWFLSIVEEVPEHIAQQFREVNRSDERALLNASAHPLWRAYNIRDTGAGIKSQLAYVPRNDYKLGIKAAIVAVQLSASLAVELSNYVDHDYRRGKRIVDVQQWAYRYTVLPPPLSLVRDVPC